MRVALFPLLLFIFSCSDSRYHVYYPHYRNEKSGIYKETRVLTEQEKKNIKHVFEYYAIPYKETDDNVLYRGEISDELLWNYTVKASDSIWLLNQ